MGCDDVPDGLLPKTWRDPTMADVEALQERIVQLERQMDVLRSSPLSPVRSLFVREPPPIQRPFPEGNRA